MLPPPLISPLIFHLTCSWILTCPLHLITCIFVFPGEFWASCSRQLSTSYDKSQPGSTSHARWIQVIFRSDYHDPLTIYGHKDKPDFTRHLYSVNSESGVVTGLDGAIQRLVVNGDAWTNIASRWPLIILIIIIMAPKKTMAWKRIIITVIANKKNRPKKITG